LGYARSVEDRANVVEKRGAQAGNLNLPHGMRMAGTEGCPPRSSLARCRKWQRQACVPPGPTRRHAHMVLRGSNQFARGPDRRIGSDRANVQGSPYEPLAQAQRYVTKGYSVVLDFDREQVRD